jgi:hypothetical protein
MTSAQDKANPPPQINFRSLSREALFTSAHFSSSDITRCVSFSLAHARGLGNDSLWHPVVTGMEARI